MPESKYFPFDFTKYCNLKRFKEHYQNVFRLFVYRLNVGCNFCKVTFTDIEKKNIFSMKIVFGHGNLIQRVSNEEAKLFASEFFFFVDGKL